MNQVGSVKICITRCGRSHDTQISGQFGRPNFYVCSAEGGTTFMWKTLSILFRIDAHTSVVQHALFTSIVQCQVNGYAYICNWCFAYSALCILRGGWEGRFFEKHSIIPSIYAQQIVLNRPPRTLHKTNYV